MNDPRFKPLDKVYWNDPDSGLCSKHGTIDSINGDTVTLQDGTECHACELTKTGEAGGTEMSMATYLRSMEMSGDSQQLILADFLIDILDQYGEEHTVECAQIVAEEALAFVRRFRKAKETPNVPMP